MQVSIQRDGETILYIEATVDIFSTQAWIWSTSPYLNELQKNDRLLLTGGRCYTVHRRGPLNTAGPRGDVIELVLRECES